VEAGRWQRSVVKGQDQDQDQDPHNHHQRRRGPEGGKLVRDELLKADERVLQNPTSAYIRILGRTFAQRLADQAPSPEHFILTSLLCRWFRRFVNDLDVA